MEYIAHRQPNYINNSYSNIDEEVHCHVKLCEFQLTNTS
jgi:hypothetical protein